MVAWVPANGRVSRKRVSKSFCEKSYAKLACAFAQPFEKFLIGLLARSWPWLGLQQQLPFQEKTIRVASWQGQLHGVHNFFCSSWLLGHLHGRGVAATAACACSAMWHASTFMPACAARHNERPQRPLNIWGMDVSKQIVSGLAAHLCGEAAPFHLLAMTGWNVSPQPWAPFMCQHHAQLDQPA